jgi:GT2 family glycosyltransferase
MTDRPRISVVIPTYNKAENLPALLGALAEQTLDPDSFEVLVVDDCSRDQTACVLDDATRSLDIALRCLRTPANSGGPSAPRNLGWGAAAAPVIAFLDDDCIPRPTWLAEAVKAMEAAPACGVCQGRTVIPAGVRIDHPSRWTVGRVVDGPTAWFEATNIFYRRDALESLGGFDETISWWGEDTDLGWRVVESGWERGFAPEAVVEHEVADRGWRWHVKFGWLDHRIIEVAAGHPQIRREGFWRPWAMHRADALFALALVGSAAAVKWKPALAATLPYLYSRRPPFRRDGINKATLLVGVQTLLVDSVRFAGHMKGSARAGILVL